MKLLENAESALKEAMAARRNLDAEIKVLQDVIAMCKRINGGKNKSDRKHNYTKTLGAKNKHGAEFRYAVLKTLDETGGRLTKFEIARHGKIGLGAELNGAISGLRQYGYIFTADNAGISPKGKKSIARYEITVEGKNALKLTNEDK